jgi:hypothetical protein
MIFDTDRPISKRGILKELLSILTIVFAVIGAIASIFLLLIPNRLD